jgi:hypothetical protein
MEMSPVQKNILSVSQWSKSWNALIEQQIQAEVVKSNQGIKITNSKALRPIN